MPTVIIGADLCPIGDNQPYFLRGDAESLFHDLLPEFAAANLVVANLECPFIQRPSPIAKTGPTFGEPGACINGIKNAGIHVLALANNHILDHGEAGLRNTLQVCAAAGIATVGAGANLAAAGQLLIRQLGSLRLGILALAENEFSTATDSRWGANPLDLITVVRTLRERRRDFDFLIILLHGGDEFHVPSPGLQRTCRFLVEQGANAVIVQHPHVLGGHEEYHGAHIVYGQGAVVMDEALYRNRESFHQGYLVKLQIAESAAATMEIIPFVQSQGTTGARKLLGEPEQLFRQSLARRSREILDAGFVQAEWLRFCEARQHGYLSSLLGHNRVLGKLNSRGLLERLLYGRIALLRARNLVCCETHREAVETIFNSRLH